MTKANERRSLGGFTGEIVRTSGETRLQWRRRKPDSWTGIEGSISER
jgi:hypothetical protein